MAGVDLGPVRQRQEAPQAGVQLPGPRPDRVGRQLLERQVDPADVAVWVTVRAGAELADFYANLRAPILVADGKGHQVINEAADAPVRAPLFPAVAAAA